MRPYKEGFYHDFKWRGWLDFGTGALGDMACHTTNMPVLATNLWDPVAVTAVQNSGLVDYEQFPSTSTLKFEFPERDGLVPTDFYWYDGGNLPPDHIIQQLPERVQQRVADQKAGRLRRRKTSGAVLVGTEGTIFSDNDYGETYDLLKDGKVVEDFTKPEQSLPRVPFEGRMDERHKWEFVKSITGEYEPGTMSNFGYAGRLTETMLVGIIALRGEVGKRYEWDAKNLKCTNDSSLNKFVHREYRDGWTL